MGVLRFEGKRDRLGREDPVGGTDGPNGQRRKAPIPGHSSQPDQSSEEPSDRSLASQEEHATSLDATSESGVASESEERTKELLAAYQGALYGAENRPAVVWVRWGDRGLGHCLKVAYL